VRAEPDDRHDRKQRERHGSARGNSRALAPARGREHRERQQEPSRGLHADTHDEHGGRRAEIAGPICSVRCSPARPRLCARHTRPRARTERPRARTEIRCPASPRRERERSRDDEQHERVVVRAADGELEQDRVQANERRRNPRRAPHLARRARRERDGAEAGGHGNRLERPQAARQAEWRERVGAEREQGTVGRMLEWPADERKRRVGGGFGRHVGVGIETVQDPQAREREVAEHVLGDEWWSQQQERVGSRNRERDRAAGQHPCAKQHGRVARAHDEREGLKARGSEPEPEAVQRTGKPAGPAAAAGRHIRRRVSRGARHHAEHARHHTHETRAPERAQRERQTPGTAHRRATVHRGR
jgi:hypothetical protein